MTTQQVSSATKTKTHSNREKGLVRVEFYLTVEERAALQKVCKQRGHSMTGFMYMLQRKAVAQALREESLL